MLLINNLYIKGEPENKFLDEKIDINTLIFQNVLIINF